MSLAKVLDRQGHEPFHACLFSFFAVMCGLMGTKSMRGSAFMDEKHFHTALCGVSCLMSIREVHANVIYWEYIRLRADAMGLNPQTPADFALARVGCLARA